MRTPPLGIVCFRVPNDSALRGVTFALQAANGYSGGSRVGLTNPAHVTLL